MPATEMLVGGFGVIGSCSCITDVDGRFRCEFERSSNELLDNDIVFSLAQPDRVIDDRDGGAWFNPKCRGHAFRSLAAEDELVLRTVPAAFVKGRALRDGTAISGAVVTLLLRWTPQDKPTTLRIASTETDDDGHFTFRGLHAAIGDGLFARIQAPDVDIVSEMFELKQDATLTLPDLHASPLAAVRGRLVDQTGSPIPAAFVALNELHGLLDTWGNNGVETDAAGRFVIRNVRPAKYRCCVTTDLISEDAAVKLIATNIEVLAGQAKDLGDLMA